jgi:hypothetical protein
MTRRKRSRSNITRLHSTNSSAKQQHTLLLLHQQRQAQQAALQDRT